MEITYLYCINNNNDDDFITTTFFELEKGIEILNFNSTFNIEDTKYVAIDYAFDPFVSINRKYTNSKVIKYYEVSFLSRDIDRMIVNLKIEKETDPINLLQYKREIKISKIIHGK